MTGHDDFPHGMNETSRAQARADRPTCGSCDHWLPHPGDPGQPGQCHLNAPVLTGGLHGPERTLWPTTDAVDWCGQHSGFALVISGELDATQLAGVEDYARSTLQPDSVLVPQPHWHVLQNAAQRLGAQRSSVTSGLWNVPSFGRIGITGQEVVDLCRETAK